MIALLRSETLRIRSRRLVWILTVLVLGGIVLGVVITAAKSHPPSGTQASETTFALAKLTVVFRHAAFFLIVLGLVIGASSMGADWQTGSMGTLLTWESRRTRVLIARTVAVVVTVFLLIVALSLVLSLLLWLVAATRGTTAGTDGVWLRHVVGLILRIAIMGGIGAILGLSISMIGRGTAAALGAIFIYLAVLETLLRSMVPKLAPYLFAENTVVFVDGHAGSPGTALVITMMGATAVVFGYAVVLLIVAWAFFRSRDVT